MPVPRKGSATLAPAAVVSCAVTGNSGTFETPLPLQGPFSTDFVQAPAYRAFGSVSCKCETVLPGCTSNASTPTVFAHAPDSPRPATWIVSVCGPSLKSLIV